MYLNQTLPDGNGRTGWIILFKECLKNNLIPVIIKNQNKDNYFAGLQEKGTESPDLTPKL